MADKWPVTSVAQVIESRLEPMEPQTSLMAFLKRHEGKRVDKRLFAKLNEEIPGYDFRLRQIASMSSIEWGEYGRSGGERGGSLLIAYRLVNLTVDTAFIAEHGIAYFGAAEERNAKRRRALERKADLARIEELGRLIRESKKELAGLLDDFHGDFYPDNTAIREAVGIKECHRCSS